MKKKRRLRAGKDNLLKKFVLLVVVLVVALVLASCSFVKSGEKFNVYYPANCKIVTDGNLCRVIDAEAGVVCYLYFQNGISCLSLKDTLLENGDG